MRRDADFERESELPIDLPVQGRPRRRLPALALVVDNTKSVDIQMSLLLEVATKAADFLPREALRYLDYGVYDLLRTRQCAQGAALRLQRKGVSLVGELTQLSRYELRLLIDRDERALGEIEAALGTVGLGLGKHFPQWKRYAPLAMQRSGRR